MELVTFALSMLLAGIVIGCGIGYYVASHIHQTANAAARAVTIPSGAIPSLPPALTTAIESISHKAQTEIANVAAQASSTITKQP
jgi:hypothetical protein